MASKLKAKLPVPAYPGSGGEMTIGGITFKVAKSLTVPQLKQAEGHAVAIKIVSPIVKSAPLKVKAETEANKKEAKKEPPFIARVLDLSDNNNEKQYIFNSVVRGNIEEAYPDQTYIGKCFAILKGAKAQGKNYNQFLINEIDA